MTQVSYYSFRFLLLQVLLLVIPVQQLWAGAWTLDKNKLWVKSSFFIQRTSERYASANFFCGDKICRNGQRAPYFFNGEIESNATYFDVWYGLTNRIELQFQLPYFEISFKDDVNPERSSTNDIGDFKFGLRYRIPFKPIVTTLKIAAKAPTGFFNKDAEEVPIGDGQWDLEISAEFGHSWSPAPIYINLGIGYKFRFEPDIEASNLDPGDEFTFRAEAGFNITNTLLVKSALDGFWGQEFTALFADSKLKLTDSDRRILYFEPGIYWMVVKSLAVEASVKMSLSGKNYPAGDIIGFGLSYTFTL